MDHQEQGSRHEVIKMLLRVKKVNGHRVKEKLAFVQCIPLSAE